MHLMKWLVILRHMGYSLLILTTANTLFGLNGANLPQHAVISSDKCPCCSYMKLRHNWERVGPMALKSKVYAASACVCRIYDLVSEGLENRWSSSHRLKSAI